MPRLSVPDPANVALEYSPPAGTVLHAGSGQTLTASTAATANDNAVTATVTINVLPVTPTITWANPADIVYGTPLGPAQLDAASSVAGTFTYTPAAGDILEAGPAQTLTATFTPADAVDFQAVMVSTPINVLRAPLVVTASDAAATYGAAIPMLSGSVVGLQNNDPVGVTFATVATVGSPVGTYAIMPTLVDPNDRMANYQVEIDYGTLTVSPAPLTVTASSASIVLGQAIPAFTASYDGFLLGDGPNVLGGTLTFSLPAGAPSQPGLFPIMPGGLSAANYAITYVDGFLDVVAPPASAPPVTVQSIRWQTLSLGHEKTAKVLVVTFSGALDPSDAQDASAYHLVSSRHGQKFGPRGEQAHPHRLGDLQPVRPHRHADPTRQAHEPGAAVVDQHRTRPRSPGTADRRQPDGQAGGNFVSTISRS